MWFQRVRRAYLGVVRHFETVSIDHLGQLRIVYYNKVQIWNSGNDLMGRSGFVLIKSTTFG